MTVDLVMQAGRVVAFGQDVKACALGQAAASVLAGGVIGRSLAELETTRAALHAMLNETGPVPAKPFDGFEVLIPARAYKNRHASIMLAIDAACDAAKQSETV